jgi:predicted Zn-dependent protease
MRRIDRPRLASYRAGNRKRNATARRCDAMSGSNRRRPAWKVLRAALAALLALPGMLQPGPASAAPGASIVRDAETESLVQDYAESIFKAAGIRSKSVRIFIVPDQSFNAFVASSDAMFVNVGTIIMSKTPNELIGVIAHETGHLAHGDLAAIREQLASAKTAALIAGLVGMGTAVAGAASGVDSLAKAGVGIVSGGANYAQRSLLSYRRLQESAADRSAVDYLNKSGQSPAGMLETLKRLASDQLFLSRQIDPYLQSHPLAQDRINALAALVAQSPNLNKKDPPDLQRRHDLVRAKLIGFTWPRDRVARAYPPSDTSLPARYARAISTYRSSSLAAALKQMDDLIASAPNDPYFWELKGQALLESGKAAESLAPLRKAVALAPNEGLIRILLGQALVAANNKAYLDEAIRNLTVGLQSAPDSPIAYRQLARAYALKGDLAMAELATAQGYFTNGEVDDAKIHAARAQAKLKPNTPPWLRADDIVSYKPPILNRSGGLN